jgi:23S rRNA pseudouridine2605 synthase
MAERLQKVISQAGVASRRHSEQMILDGRVSVNGKIVTELGTKVEPDDTIAVDGKTLTGEKNIYILLNKPKGYITTFTDPEGRKTVIDLVSDIPERVYPVGRLDSNTEGLLLMTNDGELTHGLTHPSKHVMKTYLVKVEGLPSGEKLSKLRKGIPLEEGMTAPAQVKLVEHDEGRNRTTLEIMIHEGKNRQVRRMCEAVGHPVKSLKRVKYAFLDLSGVKRGQYRHLTSQEVFRLKQLIR